jgi:poly(3-hydroxybutyrate) depolymerase
MASLRVLAAVLALCVAAMAANSGNNLQSYNIDPSRTTISGLSSGAYMATQMHVAYSSSIHGCGVFAGGPYHCAQGSLTTATTFCMDSLVGPDVASLIKYTDKQSGVAIDDTKNLTSQRAYLVSGSKDTVVSTKVVQDLSDYYVNYGVDVHFNKLTGAEHCQPTDNPKEGECSYLGSPYINYCDFDGAGAALQFIYHDTLNGRQTGALSGQVLNYSQADFGGKEIGLAPTGYLFVPAECAAGQTCGLHVAFHGCQMSYDFIGLDYVNDAGYNRWADTNNLIVLYPQTVATKELSLYNPKGCWDWWGFTDSKTYDLRDGPQMKAVWNMMNRVMGNF